MTENVTVAGMWHAAWTVENLERALEFYVGLLGMEVVHQQTQDNDYTRTLVGIEDAKLRAALLKFPNREPGLSGHVIELNEYIHPRGPRQDTRPCNICAAHFAFYTEDLHALYKRLSDRGVTFVNPPVAITQGINKGGYACYLKDFDGFTLEFLQPPEWRLSGEQPPAEVTRP